MEGKEVRLSNVSRLVVDEADRMLDMGFEPQIRKAVKEVKERSKQMLSRQHITYESYESYELHFDFMSIYVQCRMEI